jgi:soluble cytochrome b562
MVKKQSNVIKLGELDENVRKQTESVKKSYIDWLELNKTLWTETLSSFDTQVELWLSMQLGYMDLLKNLIGVKPDLRVFGKGLHPYAGQIEHINKLSREFIEIKKKKAEKVAETLQKYHRKSVESTLEAFDKYCDLLSTS